MIRIEDEKIYINRGDDGGFTVDITDMDGCPYEMAEGDFLTCTVRKTAEKGSPILLRTISSNNWIYLNHEDTSEIEAGKYSCDIQLTKANGERVTIYPELYFGNTKTIWNNFIVAGEVTIDA